MLHCCKFNPLDVYYLKDDELYSSRKLSIGFCPVCEKPVAELSQWRFDGKFDFKSVSGFEADALSRSLAEDIVYSMKECNYQKFKSRPFGWVYGINRTSKSNKREIVKQYACDFYGNKELIKTY